MCLFTVTIRSSSASTTYIALAPSSSVAWANAADMHGDDPCGITVTPA
jgi:hypothetical protein